MGRRIWIPKYISPICSRAFGFRQHGVLGITGSTYIIPIRDISQLRRIVRSEVTEHLRAASLHSQPQEVEKVEQGERWENAEAARLGLNLLNDEAGVVLDQVLDENLERAGGLAEVANEKVSEDGPGDVGWCGVGIVVLVPFV